MVANFYSKEFNENLAKRGLGLVLLIIFSAIIIAICQSNAFSSNLWVVIKVGVDEWYEYIKKTIDLFPIWAFITGIVFIIDYIAVNQDTEIIKILWHIIFQFIIGFSGPYIFVFSLSIIYYIPLGIISFIFPDKYIYASFGFGLLCASITVFILIALDMPEFLIFVIRKIKNIFFKNCCINMPSIVASSSVINICYD